MDQISFPVLFVYFIFKVLEETLSGSDYSAYEVEECQMLGLNRVHSASLIRGNWSVKCRYPNIFVSSFNMGVGSCI